MSITTELEVPPGAEVTSLLFFAQNKPEQLEELVRLVDSGKLTVDIGERLPLSALAEVHRRSERGDIRGKVIVIP